MMITVANPIYDSVFKYLMEDERIANIIVQIPLLRGQINNRLDEVLSVFDQTYKDKRNRQVLNIDEDMYDGDEEMNRIIRRLLSAASDAKLRQDMNVEDEYFTAIENRDTAIMQRDKKIAEQDAQIAEQGAQIAEQGAQLAATIKMLIAANVSIEKIAVNLNISEEDVMKISAGNSKE